MSKVISIANTAGGVGKTTTAHALAACFVDYGKRVLLIDLDAKADLTFRLARENDRTFITDYLNAVQISEATLEKTVERFSFIGSDSRISNIETVESFDALLKSLSPSFDVVVLDLPSTISPSIALALRASDLLLIPIRNSLHSIRGAYEIISLSGGKDSYALQIGDLAKEELSIKYIDAQIAIGSEVELSEEESISVVTKFKEGMVSESYRDAAYSVLEVLGLD